MTRSLPLQSAERRVTYVQPQETRDLPAPKTTIWDLEAHSRAKHEILKRYLQAWVPILGQGARSELVYIDGFAGTGRYSNGEDGSPVIALKAALHRHWNIKPRMTFFFVERNCERAGFLKQVLDDMKLPRKFSTRVAAGSTFEEAVTNFIDCRTSNGQPLPPTFAFIDPFGWSGVPFDLIRRILSYPRCEVLITFMYEEINRFLGHPDQVNNFNSYFGTGEWEAIIREADPRQRNRGLHDLYLRQLRNSAKVRYVRSFEMRNDRDVTDYFLFYATNNLLGLKKMKEAMWKVDKSGEFKFSDATDPRQMVLFGTEPRADVLKDQLIKRFRGRETTIGEIEEFVVSETAFRETHYKRQVLKPLEMGQPPKLDIVDPPPSRKVGTYSRPNQKVRFL